MGSNNSREEESDASSQTTSKSVSLVEYKTDNEFMAKYMPTKIIGKGPRANIIEAVAKSTGEKYAVKIIDKRTVDDIDTFRSNLNLAIAIDHPNIVKCYEYFEDKKRIYIVNELMEGGELFDRISNKNFFSEEDVRNILKTILNALNYCHQRGIIHGDIKPENILLKDITSDSVIKISDYGYSISLVSNRNNISTLCGNTEYLAPEIIISNSSSITSKNNNNNNNIDHNIYDTQIDMWSIGIISYVLLSGTTPFNTLDGNPYGVFRKIVNGEYSFPPKYWDTLSYNAREFVNKLLETDPVERLTPEKCLGHDFIIQPQNIDTISDNLNQFKIYNVNRKKWQSFINTTKLVIHKNEFTKKELGYVDMRQRYIFGKRLGKGHIGEVYSGTNIKTNEEVAIKLIPKTKIRYPESLKERVILQQKFSHPYITKVIEFVEDRDFYYIVYPLLHEGDCIDCLATKEYYSEYKIKIIMEHVCEAIQYLHDHCTNFYNLKPSNVLIENYMTKDPTIQISDMGSLRAVYENIEHPYLYCDCLAPEVLLKKKNINRVADVWSIGVVTYTLLCGKTPFRNYNDLMKGKFDWRGKQWIYVSDEAKDFVKKCLVVDVNERMMIEQVLEHPFFTKHREYSELCPVLDEITNYDIERKRPKHPTTIILPEEIRYVTIPAPVETRRKVKPKKEKKKKPIPLEDIKENNENNMKELEDYEAPNRLRSRKHKKSMRETITITEEETEENTTKKSVKETLTKTTEDLGSNLSKSAVTKRRKTSVPNKMNQSSVLFRKKTVDFLTAGKEHESPFRPIFKVAIY